MDQHQDNIKGYTDVNDITQPIKCKIRKNMKERKDSKRKKNQKHIKQTEKKQQEKK